MVWYAAYGSNMNYERMMCYIEGGKPEFAKKANIGCADKTPPVKSKVKKFNGKLFFAGQSYNWSGSAVAFIKRTGMKKSKDFFYARLYLVTEEQFIQIARQEGAHKVELEKAIKTKSVIENKDTWYGDIVYLGKSEGYPIVTFTSERFFTEKEAYLSHEYGNHIARGLIQMKFSIDEIKKYLSKCNIQRRILHIECSLL